MFYEFCVASPIHSTCKPYIIVDCTVPPGLHILLLNIQYIVEVIVLVTVIVRLQCLCPQTMKHCSNGIVSGSE